MSLLLSHYQQILQKLSFRLPVLPLVLLLVLPLFQLPVSPPLWKVLLQLVFPAQGLPEQEPLSALLPPVLLPVPVLLLLQAVLPPVLFPAEPLPVLSPAVQFVLLSQQALQQYFLIQSLLHCQLPLFQPVPAELQQYSELSALPQMN